MINNLDNYGLGSSWNGNFEKLCSINLKSSRKYLYREHQRINSGRGNGSCRGEGWAFSFKDGLGNGTGWGCGDLPYNYDLEEILKNQKDHDRYYHENYFKTDFVENIDLEKILDNNGSIKDVKRLITILKRNGINNVFDLVFKNPFPLSGKIGMSIGTKSKSFRYILECITTNGLKFGMSIDEYNEWLNKRKKDI